MGSGIASPVIPDRSAAEGKGIHSAEPDRGSPSRAPLSPRVWLIEIHQPPHVITGLVPVIPMMSSAVLFLIGMAGTRPAMTEREANDEARD